MRRRTLELVLPLVKQWPLLFRTLRYLNQMLRQALASVGLAQSPLPNEAAQARRIIAQSAGIAQSNGPAASKILFFSVRAWATHLAWEMTIAHSLMRRGAECRFFFCSGEQPACDVLNWYDRSPATCDYCARFTRDLAEQFHLPFDRLNELVTGGDLNRARAIVEDCAPEHYEEFEYDGFPLGQYVQPSVARFLCSGSLGQDEASRKVYKDFLVSAVLMLEASKRLLDQVHPNVVVMSNGLFFAERGMFELARRRGIRTVTYEVGFRDNTVIFAHDRPVVDLEIPELWERFKDQPLTRGESAKLDQYLEFRRQASKTALTNYFPSVEADPRKIYELLGLDPKRPIVTLFSNILWDTAIYQKEIAFPSMFDWIAQTIEYFSTLPEVQLVIRVHPAEVRLVGQVSRERVSEAIRQRFPSLPSNVLMVPSDSNISSYVLMELSCLGLVYTSTVGMEMPLMGLPVIVAAETHYRGKGFTFDVNSAEEYRRTLDRILKEPSVEEDKRRLEIARRYAYSFLFRFMIPFPRVSHLGRNLNRFTYTQLEDLDPGEDPYLDLICSGILEGREFAVNDTLLDVP